MSDGNAYTTQLGSNYHIYKVILLSVLPFVFVCLFFLLCKCTAWKREWPNKAVSIIDLILAFLIHFVVDGPETLMMEKKFFLARHVTAIKSMKSNFIAGSSNISLFDRVNSKINRNVCKRKKAKKKNTNKWIIRKKKSTVVVFFSSFSLFTSPIP